MAWRNHFTPGFGPPECGRRVFYLESKVKLCNIFLNFRIPRMGYFSFIISRDLFLPCILPQTTWPTLRYTTPRSFLLSSTTFHSIPSWKVFNIIQYHGYHFHYFYTFLCKRKCISREKMQQVFKKRWWMRLELRILRYNSVCDSCYRHGREEERLAYIMEALWFNLTLVSETWVLVSFGQCWLEDVRARVYRPILKAQ